MQRFIIGFVLCVLLSTQQLLALLGLNYTGSQPGFMSAHSVFKKNDQARGFIRFNSGFTVMPDARVSMDVPLLVLGPLDLRETGTIRLISDLFLDSSVTLTSGGRIDGQGHRVVCNGDFTIPSGKVLHINGNTILDMDNHLLMISDNAQIVVDVNVTLTIANATIRNGKHTLTFPPLRCSALTSKLALSNVNVSPGNDFLFPQGQLFIHKDVAFTGTSAFIYTSPVPSMITANSCFYFDKNTTLSVAPSTFTDASYTLKNTYTNNAFIQMADASSVLCFNGCTLRTTQTGCRFSKGTIALNNHVTCESQSALVLTSTGIQLDTKDFGAVGNTVYSVHWSSDGKYLAAGAGFGVSPYKGNQLVIYSFNGSLLTTCTNASYGTGSGTYVSGVRWSPDGKFLAAVGNPTTPTLSGYQLQVYAFSGSTLTLSAKVGLGNFGYNLRWSPDGKYLATVGPNNKLQIYQFKGNALILAAETTYSVTPCCLDWSPNGKTIAVVLSNNAGGPEIYIHQFDGSLTTVTSVEYGAIIQGVAWSPDSRFLAVAGGVSNSALKVYRFDGANLISIAQVNYGSNAVWCSWSPDGRYVVFSGSSPGSNGNEVQIHAFNGSSLTLLKNAQVNLGTGSFTIGANDWSCDGKFLVFGGSLVPTPVPSETHKQLEVYRLGYVRDTSAQAYSNSIVFGDSRYGTSRDAMVTVLAGARVDLTGKMMDDNFNG